MALAATSLECCMVRACAGLFVPGFRARHGELRFLTVCAVFCWLLPANGRGVAKSKRRAVESFRLGCENGNGDSCYYSGWLTLAGKGVARDTSKGVRLLRQGCKLTHGKCCSMIGSMYVRRLPAERQCSSHT